MEKWEYLTFRIDYNKKQKNWMVERADRPPLVGLQAILEAHGSRGWELIGLQPDRFDAEPGFGTWHARPAAYRATFKRRIDDGS
jgi:hypothetical protein